MFSHWIKDKTGKTYPIRFSQSVMMQLAVEEGINANDLQKFLSEFTEWPLGRVYRFYQLAFISGGKKEGQKFEMDQDDFIEWISDDETVMPEVLKAFSASMPEKKTRQEVKPIKRR